MGHMHTMEYNSALTKKESLPYAITWTNLEAIVFSYICQTEKDTYCVMPLV